MKRSLLLSTAALAIAMMPLGAAEAQGPFDNPGLYFGVHGGFFSGNVDVVGDEMFGGPIDGFIGGGLIGYNFARTPGQNVLFGVEADFGVGNVTGIGVAMDVVDTYAYDLHWDAHFRVRAGAPSGNVMPFVAAGLALADLRVESLYTGTLAGLSLGAGLDAALGPNLIGRAEALYDIYCDKDFEYGSEEGTVSLSGFTFRLAAIFKLP